MTGDEPQTIAWVERRDLAPAPHLKSGGIHCWLAPLARECIDIKILNAAEKERARKLRFDRDRLRFLAGRTLLRRILAAYCGAAPATLQLIEGDAGKPALKLSEHSVRFNYSRSSGWALLAIAKDFSIGADIEEIRPAPDLTVVAQQNFSEQENAALKRFSPARRLEAFYDCWTRKEAFVKATGEGITAPLPSIEMGIDPAAAAVFAPVDGPAADACWSLMAFRPLANFRAAIVCDHPAPQAEFFRWG